MEMKPGLYLYDEQPFHCYGLHLIDRPDKYTTLKLMWARNFFSDVGGFLQSDSGGQDHNGKFCLIGDERDKSYLFIEFLATDDQDKILHVAELAAMQLEMDLSLERPY